MTMRRSVLPIIIAFAVGVVACGEEPSTPVAQASLQESGASFVTYGMESFLRSNGIRSASLVADSAFAYSDSSLTYLYGVDMTMYTEEGAVRATLTSERGVLHERSDIMTAHGTVVLQVSDPQMRIESPELRYNPTGQGSIESDSATTITRATGEVTRGTCFRSDLQFQRWNICNIRGDIGGETGNR